MFLGYSLSGFIIMTIIMLRASCTAMADSNDDSVAIPNPSVGKEQALAEAGSEVVASELKNEVEGLLMRANCLLQMISENGYDMSFTKVITIELYTVKNISIPSKIIDLLRNALDVLEKRLFELSKSAAKLLNIMSRLNSKISYEDEDEDTLYLKNTVPNLEIILSEYEDYKAKLDGILSDLKSGNFSEKKILDDLNNILSDIKKKFDESEANN